MTDTIRTYVCRVPAGVDLHVAPTGYIHIRATSPEDAKAKLNSMVDAARAVAAQRPDWSPVPGIVQ